MKKKLEKLVQVAISSLQEQGDLPKEFEISIHVERARDKQFGDYATNVAMMLAKSIGLKPRDLANLIVANIPKNDLIEEITIAGPGFINFFLSHKAFTSVIAKILEKDTAYFRSNLGQGRKINIEFVSANPTGPLHVGHGRGATYGAALGDLLEEVGYQVHREYYVNDAGRQMNILAVSVWLRYLELLGAKFVFPVNAYKGDYIKNIATMLHQNYQNELYRDIDAVFADVPPDETSEGGDKEAHIDAIIANAKALLKEQYNKVYDLALITILNDIKEDLENFGVKYQEWFSERELMKSGAIDQAIEQLRKNGYLYERDGATWFHSIPFGDDKDRVLVRENGQTTYFASDIAYIFNKFDRGFDEIIYIFGADHHGYLNRLKAAGQALGFDTNKVHILLVQFAVLYRGAEKVQMSTRGGTFVTLRQLYEEVGTDAARFFYLLRKREQHMDFDLELAKSQSSENPIYYIQYAHARIRSVFRQLKEKNLAFDQAQGLDSLESLTEEHEKTLLADLSRYKETLKTAAIAFEPHQVANFLYEIANDFHTYYNAFQFLVADDKLRNARLCLIEATQKVIFHGLTLLKVSAPESM